MAAMSGDIYRLGKGYCYIRVAGHPAPFDIKTTKDTYLCCQMVKVVDVMKIIVYHRPMTCWPGGRVVMQRFAKPCTSVQFRSGPPFPKITSTTIC